MAAFGPLCLDKKSEYYGYVTTTPKKGWHFFNLLGSLLEKLERKAKEIRVGFDTDVNVVAANEF